MTDWDATADHMVYGHWNASDMHTPALIVHTQCTCSGRFIVTLIAFVWLPSTGCCHVCIGRMVTGMLATHTELNCSSTLLLYTLTTVCKNPTI